MKKIIFIATILSFAMTLQSKENIELNCKANLQNDSLLISLIIKNNDSGNKINVEVQHDDVYFNTSDWYFTGSGSLHGNYSYPPAMQYLQNQIFYYPAKYNSISEYHIGGGNDHFIDYQPKYFPKIVYVEDNDSLIINFTYSNVNGYEGFDITEDYKLSFILGYSNMFEFIEFAVQNPEIYEYISSPDSINIDLKDFNKKNKQNVIYKKYYTKLNTDNCMVNILKILFLKRIECDCIIEKE